MLVAAFFVLRSGVRPLCHRGVDAAFAQWMLENSRTNGPSQDNYFYPNAGGKGSNSLAMIEPFIGHDIQRYAYVPGLRCNDPKDLVLMYMKNRTHYSWHGDTGHTVFSPRRWMVVSPDISLGGPCPEGGELLDTPEFKKRIERTVAFLKKHQRPYWQVVTREQEDFLRTIED